MKQWYRKKVAAVGLSVCLAASQGIIPLSAYGQDSGPDQKDIHITQTETAESVDANQAKDLSDSVSNQKAKAPSDFVLDQQVNEKLTQHEEQTSSAYQADFDLNGKQTSSADKSDSGLSGNQDVLIGQSDSNGNGKQDASISQSDSNTKGKQDASSVKTDSNGNGKQDSPAVQSNSDSNGNAQKEESSAIQITGWSWIDPDQHLVNGALIIPGTGKAAPLDFDQIVAMLPQAISATVAGGASNSEKTATPLISGKAKPSVNSGKAGAPTGKSKTDGASNSGSAGERIIPLNGWSCDAFQQTSSGSWPTAGEYTFKAHFAYGGGYTLAKGSAPLEVKVMLGGGNVARDPAEEQSPVLTPNPELNNLLKSAETGDFTVTGGTLNQDYAYSTDEKGVLLTIKTSTPLTIQNTDPNTPTSNRIEVADKVTANVTLSGVNIDTSKLKDYTRAFQLDGAAICNLTLADGTTNTLKSSKFSAGLQVETYQGKTATLNIGGTGTLMAYGGPAGSGIGGGGKDSSAGTININSGTIKAYGGGAVSYMGGTAGTAGIGGGTAGSGGTITIKGGTIEAYGKDGGAGIGGGKLGNGGVIHISGGVVKAVGDNGGAGIGAGKGGVDDHWHTIDISGGTIDISGGTVTAQGKGGGAGIGGGGQTKAGSVTIRGGVVNASADTDAAGIGGGSTGGTGSVTISAGVVSASSESAQYAPGIGGGANGGDVTFSTGDKGTGQAVISANAITTKTDQEQWNGLIFDGDKGKVYGDSVTLKTDVTIPSGKTLTVDPGKTLKVDAGVTLNVGTGATLNVGTGGTLNNQGNLAVKPGASLETAKGSKIQNTGTVEKTDQKVDSVTVTPTTVTYGVSAPVITPVNAAGGAEVVYSAVSNTSGESDATDVASVSGQTITVKKAGTFYVKAVIDESFGYNGKTVYSGKITVTQPSAGGSSSGNVPGGGSSSGSHVPSGGSSGGGGGGASSGGGGGSSSGGGSHDQGDSSAANTVVIPQTMVPKSASPFAHAASAFTDIDHQAAKADIEFVVDRGLLFGTSDTQFSPDTPMTRGMFITVLGRLAGIDPGAYSSSASFQDVSSSDYYAPYVIWGTGKGVVSGMSQTTFAPNQPISYQEMAVMLSNYVKAMDAQLSQTHQGASLSDSDGVAAWAAEAVQQMEAAGVLGKGDTGAFDPAAGVTRAQAASALHQFVKDIQTK